MADQELTSALCFECDKPLWSGESTVDLNDGDWAHEACYRGQYSVCCGALVDPDIQFCPKCNERA